MKKLLMIVLLILLMATTVPASGQDKTTPEPCPNELVITRMETVHAFKAHASAILLFVFVDRDCDAEADAVLVYRYLGKYSGEHCFEQLAIISVAEALEVIEGWKVRTKQHGRSA